MKTHNIMIDIETLGKAPGCVILSIGAVYFTPMPAVCQNTAFYAEISQSSCVAAGLTMDEATVDWWTGQSQEARSVLNRTADGGDALPLAFVLGKLEHWIGQLGCKRSELDVWAKGPSFDLAILASAYRAVGVRPPWMYYNERCVRTITSLPVDARGMDADTSEWADACSKIQHNALSDAVAQAKQVSVRLAKIKGEQQ